MAESPAQCQKLSVVTETPVRTIAKTRTMRAPVTTNHSLTPARLVSMLDTVTVYPS